MFEKRKNLWKISSLVAILVVVSLTYVFANRMQPSYHGIAVLKSADPLAAIGDNVTYRIRVFNPSDFDLHNINVTDPLIGLNTTIPFMAAHNETGVAYIMNRTVLASDPNPLVNTVSVEAIDSQGMRSSASTQAKTTIFQRLIRIEKTGPEFAHERDAIKYTIVVTNLANSSIANVTVEDEVLGFGWKGDLAKGESDVFNITYVVLEGAADPLVNTVTVSAMLNETVIYDEATWTVDILHPKLSVQKTVEPKKVHAGENVTYTIVVKNIGDTTLFNLTLVDSIYGNASAGVIPPSLIPGHWFAWSFNITIHECTINRATATGMDALGRKVSASSKTYVEVILPFCPRSIGYWKTHPNAWPIDEIKVGNVTYSKQMALEMLEEANAKDATKMLAAQLIAAKLNRLSGASPSFRYWGTSMNIDDIISQGEAFLTNHQVGSNPQGENRQTALHLKDVLDAYNNSECHEFEFD